MLRSLLQKLRPVLHADFLAVELSDSFQTLSRRLEAMKHFKTRSRGEWFVIGCALAMFGTIAVVPWRLVAQETVAPPAGDKGVTNSDQPPAAQVSSGQDSAAAEAEAKEVAQQRRKLLVGRWRDANQKEVVFFEDGTYEDFGVNIFGREGYVTRDNVRRYETNFERGQGQWILDGSSLTLLQDHQSRLWNQNKQAEQKPKSSLPSSRYYILRLDDSFLRLKHPGSDRRFFFRRIEEKPVENKLSEVPAEMQKIAELARLSVEETIPFATWLANQRIEDADLQKIGRIIDARRRKITLAELFSMDDAQVSEYQQLLRQTRGRYDKLQVLADGEQLSPIELQAFNKIRATVGSLDALANVILDVNDGQVAPMFSVRVRGLQYPPRTNRAPVGGGFRGRGDEGFGGRQPAKKDDGDLVTVPDDVRLDKVAAAFGDLERWFNETVFAVPSE